MLSEQNIKADLDITDETMRGNYVFKQPLTF